MKSLEVKKVVKKMDPAGFYYCNKSLFFKRSGQQKFYIKGQIKDQQTCRLWLTLQWHYAEHQTQL